MAIVGNFRLTRATRRTMVQGLVPAEGLGVSPNSLIFPQEWGPGG